MYKGRLQGVGQRALRSGVKGFSTECLCSSLGSSGVNFVPFWPLSQEVRTFPGSCSAGHRSPGPPADPWASLQELYAAKSSFKG